MMAGRPLTESIRNILLDTARQMSREGLRKYTLKFEEAEGTVRTDFRYSSLGTFGGVLFVADVEMASGRTRVTFLVPEEELTRNEEGREGFWLEADERRSQRAPFN